MTDRVISAEAVINAKDNTGDVFTNIARKISGVGKAANVSPQINDMAKALGKAQEQMKALDKFQNNRSTFTEARAKFNAMRQAVENTGKAMKAAEAPTRAMAAAHVAAQRAVSQASGMFEKQTSIMVASKRALEGYGIPLAKVASEQARLRSVIDQTTRAIEGQTTAEQRAARAHAAAEKAIEHRREGMQHHGAKNYVLGAAAGYVSGHAIVHGIGDTIKAGARYQHEVVALKNAGRTPEEMIRIQAASRATSRALPTATYEENLKVVNETTGAFGTLEHAIENLTFMQKSASVLHAAAGDKIDGDAGALGNQLARFFEERQITNDVPRFQREAEGLVRAMAFTRGNFNPEQALAFAQQAKSSLPNYSERFLTGVAPSLVTMLGGQRAGTAANSFNSVITGKVNDSKQAEEWMRYGLLDPSMVVNKAGKAVGWRAGAVTDTSGAMTDPLKWAEEVALPAMRAHGVNTDDRMALTKVLATMFRNSTANVFANDIMQAASRQRLHKDEDNIHKAGTLDEIYNRNLSEDPTVAMTALTASLDNLMTSASSPAMQAAAKGITYVAGALGSVAEFGKDHPGLAVTGGVGAAAGGLFGAGKLSYSLMNGFGLKGSAVALDHSAGQLIIAADRLGMGGKPGGPPGTPMGEPGGKPSLWGPVWQVMLYEAGKSGIDWLMNSMPHVAWPKGYDPDKAGRGVGMLWPGGDKQPKQRDFSFGSTGGFRSAPSAYPEGGFHPIDGPAYDRMQANLDRLPSARMPSHLTGGGYSDSVPLPPRRPVEFGGVPMPGPLNSGGPIDVTGKVTADVTSHIDTTAVVKVEVTASPELIARQTFQSVTSKPSTGPSMPQAAQGTPGAVGAQ